MRTNQRGSALLAVIWLTAALSAIAFTVANTVRAETERTSTEVDSLKAYYLATGAIDEARSIARDHTDAALAVLERYPASPARTALAEIARSMTARAV